jgi:RNA polymerase sigma factor (sigma-70 family)
VAGVSVKAAVLARCFPFIILSVRTARRSPGEAIRISERRRAMSSALHPGVDLKQVYLAMRYDLVRYVLRRLRDPHNAEDVVSDVYLRLERVTDPIATEVEAQRYIYRIASNLLIDYVRVNNRRLEILETNMVLVEDEGPNFERGVIAQGELALIHEAFDDLPDKARDIIYYSRIAGMTHEQIADRMGISRSLIEKYIIRAMRHFRDRLREAEEIVEPDLPAARPQLRVIPGGAQG